MANSRLSSGHGYARVDIATHALAAARELGTDAGKVLVSFDGSDRRAASIEKIEQGIVGMASELHSIQWLVPRAS